MVTATVTCLLLDRFRRKRSSVAGVDDASGVLRHSRCIREAYDIEAAVAVRVPDVTRLLVVRRRRHRERAGLHRINRVVPRHQGLVEVRDLSWVCGIPDVEDAQSGHDEAAGHDVGVDAARKRAVMALVTLEGLIVARVFGLVALVHGQTHVGYDERFLLVLYVDYARCSNMLSRAELVGLQEVLVVTTRERSRVLRGAQLRPREPADELHRRVRYTFL